MKSLLSALLFSFLFAGVHAQPAPPAETPPPGTPPSLTWWNLLHYTIAIQPDYTSQYLSGSNTIRFRVLHPDSVLQIDLQQPMHITTITWQGQFLPVDHNENAWLVRFPHRLKPGATETIEATFEGHPTVAHKAPWDGGWIWTKDSLGRPWMTVACEAGGASIWLPCKQTAYDEPDSGITFHITAPDTLVAIANGRLLGKTPHDNHTSTWTWSVINPINDYDMIPYIGSYTTWHEDYRGLKGRLDCDYWVLDYNLPRAQQQFRQVDTMLHCFEYWLGPYPFYEDSYKLVETPYLGMEHQSAIAYGNHFTNSYLGRDLSQSGWGMKFDFIMVHESGHEWFGNSITASRAGESWIHEGFTKYLETIYVGYVFGSQAGNDYATGIFKRIRNDDPILGSGSSDSYNKGSAMLHMIRQIMGDSTFRNILRGLSKTFYHQTVTTDQLLHYINQHSKRDLTHIFDQYLRTTQVPLLEYSLRNNTLQYRWIHSIAGFDMPVKVSFDRRTSFFIYPTTKWQKLTTRTTSPEDFTIDRNFYIEKKSVSL